jgi:hypothetical protein
MQGVFLLCLCLLIVFGACRRNQPSLVDKNQPPDTELWYAPPDSTDYEYLVHLYWRGLDPDGTVEQYIWTIQDSLVEGELAWDPANRLRDFRTGRITTRTDSIFSFTAFRDVGGVGVKKNRQAFYIASIDDNGVIDPFPAAVEFIATIDKLPRIAFTTHIGGVSTPYTFREIPKDTVGVFEAFQISYHGITTNTDDPLKRPREYKFFPLTGGVELEGQDEWYDDLTDTIRTFPNTGDDELPSGVFKFAAQCRDDARAESPVDAGTLLRGVCQVVVNFDPETRIHDVKNRYTVDDVVYERDIDFNDGFPDTVSYDSWVWINYTGTDSDRDEPKCPPTDPNKCIGFQVAYFRDSERIAGAQEFSLWQPRNGVHDTDDFSATDSNTFHIGSLEYDLFARAIDENGRPDGTPPSVSVVGNFNPVIDSFAVEDHLGNRIDLSVVDTLKWDFWKGEGYPYLCQCDTVARPQVFCDNDPNFECKGREYPFNNASGDFYKSWSIHIKAWTHDNPKDPTGSGVKAWQYIVKNSQGQFLNLGKGLAGWFDGAEIDVLDDVIRWVVYYPSTFSLDPTGPPDPYGETVYAKLRNWMDEDLTFFLIGRDTAKLEGEFEQSIFINGEPAIINVFPASSLGRWTEEKVFTFQVTLMPNQ